MHICILGKWYPKHCRGGRASANRGRDNPHAVRGRTHLKLLQATYRDQPFLIKPKEKLGGAFPKPACNTYMRQ